MPLTDNDFDADFNAVRAALKTITDTDPKMTQLIDPLLHIAQRLVTALEGIEQNTRSIT